MRNNYKILFCGFIKYFKTFKEYNFYLNIMNGLAKHIFKWKHLHRINSNKGLKGFYSKL